MSSNAALAHSELALATIRSKGTLRQRALTLGAILTAFFVLQATMPLSTAVKIGADEDFELSKATLCLHGYHLYTQIWDDQPPLDTFLVTQILKYLPHPILFERLFTVLCGSALLAAFFFIVLRITGLVPAAIATGLLIASPGLIELSGSCMQEVPALAPVIVSLAVLIWFSGSRFFAAELLAGVCFGWALQMKLIGLLYAPLCAVLICFPRRQTKGFSVTDLVPAAGTFAVTAAVTFVVLNLVTGNSLVVQLEQSWDAHFAAAKTSAYGSPLEHPFDWWVLLRNWDTTVPAVLGIAFLAKHARSDFLKLLPVAWLGLTLVVFSTHKPWWSFYYVHNAIPLCWCAGVGAWAVWQTASQPGRRWRVALYAVPALAILVWSGARIYFDIQSVQNRPKIYNSLVLKEIERFRPFAPFLFTDQPVYSFHSGIPMPPKLAMITLKRMWSGGFTIQQLVEELDATKPGLILLVNDTKDVPYQNLLSREYRLVYQDRDNRLYAHASIAKRAPLRELQ